jgi:hypothetical protein
MLAPRSTLFPALVIHCPRLEHASGANDSRDADLSSELGELMVVKQPHTVVMKDV